MNKNIDRIYTNLDQKVGGTSERKSCKNDVCQTEPVNNKSSKISKSIDFHNKKQQNIQE